MQQNIKGTIIKGVGGLYYVRPDGTDELIPCRARGKFRHEGLTPLVGDRVLLAMDNEAVIAEIIDRKNALIRPPLANLDILFVSMASSFPSPILLSVDKLICIAEHHGIEPVIVVGKSELDSESTEKICEIYRHAGFEVFALSAKSGEGVDELVEYLKTHLCGKIAAFAGASGVGKSTLLSRLFPDKEIETGEISQKIERGKNTTRHVELFDFPCSDGMGYIADTPGFSLLDFVRFDFFDKEDLPNTMRDFRTHLGSCRYKKCTHTKEDGCAILEAVKNREIAPSRHESFLEIYEALKDKPKWQKG